MKQQILFLREHSFIKDKNLEMIVIFIMIMIFAIFMVPIYYGICDSEQRYKKEQDRERTIKWRWLMRMGYRETIRFTIEHSRWNWP